MKEVDAGITVVVCTRNRAAQLARMLTSLAASCQTAGATAPVLIIDNGSTDETQEVVAGFASRWPLRCVRHETAGLSAARNRAISECASDVIWFLDDDVIVSPGWFQAVRQVIATHPEADWFGGRVLPVWQSPRPRWLGDAARFRGMFVWYDPGGGDRPLSGEMPYFFGANFGFRRRIFAAGLRFDERLGRIADRHRLGEDFALQSALARRGRLGYYVASAPVEHPVDVARTRLRYLAAWHLESGRATVTQAADLAHLPRALGVPRYLLRRAIELLAGGCAQASCGIIALNSVRLITGLADLCRALGMLRQIVEDARVRARRDPVRAMRSATPLPPAIGATHT